MLRSDADMDGMFYYIIHVTYNLQIGFCTCHYLEPENKSTNLLVMLTYAFHKLFLNINIKKIYY